MMTALRILVSGANGFVGQVLCEALREKGYSVRKAVRTNKSPKKNGAPNRDGVLAVGSISGNTDWAPALDGTQVVIHLAARAHVARETSRNVLAEYRKVNVAATERLAQAAAASRVQRLIFMSSVKVSGERTSDRPFTETVAPRPEDAYGISKWEAEQALGRIARETGLEVIVVRAPLVYGPGVKGNFLSLMRLVARGWPLPLRDVRNSRSLIFVGNLVGAIIACVSAPAAAGKTYLVSDDEDISTPDLIRAIASALGVPARLFPCPVALLKVGAALLGKSGEMARLTGSLQVDSSRIKDELGWRPRFTLAEGLEETAKWFREAGSRE